ncbi:xylulokinase [Geoglobus ahangari]
MGSLIAAVDVGTTSIKAGVVDTDDYSVRSFSSRKAEVIHPKEGLAEKDPERLWNTVADLLREVCDGHDVDALVFTAHMAGIVPLDSGGEPLGNMIIWLDERGKGYPRELWSGPLRVQGYSLPRLLRFLRITGGAPSRTGKDVLSKLAWMMENEPERFGKVRRILDVKGYLIYRACGEIVTSQDEAHLTWLADTRKGKAEWHSGLMKEYGLSPDLFPEIRDSTDIAGRVGERVAGELGISPGTPVVVGAGDMCTAAIGSGAIGEGEVHVYIGTSDWVAAHISKRKADLKHYIGTLLSGIPGKYLLVAEQEVAGGAIDWLMDLTGVDSHEEVERIARAETNLLFTPWFFGERAPLDDGYIRGSLVNLSLKTGKGEVFRALMEGIALNIGWAYEIVEGMVGRQAEVKVTGGGARFDLLCEIIASTLNRRVVRTASPEMAGLRGLGVIGSVALGKDTFGSAASKFRFDRTFNPDKRLVNVYRKKMKHFRDYYKKTKGLFRSLNEGLF